MIESGGYAGIFFLMVLENIFPPIPSEVVIPLAGFAAADGELSLPLVILFATLGAVVGCIPWYVLGRVFGITRVKALAARFGRVLTLEPHDVDRAQGWFGRHGRAAVFFGRLVPTIRTLISVPAGIARMPFVPFVLYSFAGSAIWTTLLASLGYMLQSQYGRVEAYLDPVSNGVIFTIIAIYLYRVVTFKKNGNGVAEKID